MYAYGRQRIVSFYRMWDALLARTALYYWKPPSIVSFLLPVFFHFDTLHSVVFLFTNETDTGLNLLTSQNPLLSKYTDLIECAWSWKVNWNGALSGENISLTIE